MKRCHSILILGIHVSLELEQQPHHLEIPFICCIVQRCLSFIVRDVHIGSKFLREYLNAIKIFSLCSEVQWCITSFEFTNYIAAEFAHHPFSHFSMARRFLVRTFFVPRTFSLFSV